MNIVEILTIALGIYAYTLLTAIAFGYARSFPGPLWEACIIASFWPIIVAACILIWPVCLCCRFGGRFSG